MSEAKQSEADMSGVFAELANLAPNHKALSRAVARVRERPGVVRAGIAYDGTGIVVVLRCLREVTARDEAVDLFSETALVYSRIFMRPSRNRSGTSYGILRASFCLHALERFVERSAFALELSLLAAVDAEAIRILRGVARGQLIEDAGDTFSTAIEPGVWAGRVDRSGLEPDWGPALPSEEDRIPFFSARTFLSPEEMRPVVWAKWGGGLSLSVA